jgi:hypothetical protein
VQEEDGYRPPRSFSLVVRETRSESDLNVKRYYKGCRGEELMRKYEPKRSKLNKRKSKTTIAIPGNQ